MVDAPEAPVTPAVPVAASVSDSTIIANPTVSPAVETVTTPVTDTAAVPPDAATSVTGSTEIPTPSTVESVLGDAKPAEVKPETAKPAELATAEKKVDAKPEGEAAKVEALTEVVLPTYEEFKVPEGITLDKEPVAAFTKILGEIETGKLDHAAMQAKGQELIDLAAKSTTDSINRLNDYYVKIHNDQKKSWFEAFKADPEMGGEKTQDTMFMLQKTVSEYGGNEAQISEFRQMVNDTGVTNNPALIRLVYNMQKKIDSYTTESGEDSTTRVVPAMRPAPSKVKDYQRFYAGS